MSVHMTRWFRRHQKHLMAGLVILLMAAFGILTPLSSALSKKGRYVGRIRDKRVLESDLDAGRRVVGVLNALGMARVLQYGQDSALDGAMRRLGQDDFFSNFVLFSNMGAMSRFVFDGDPEDSNSAAWRALVLLREAEAAGIQATVADAESLKKTLEIAPLVSRKYGWQFISLGLIETRFREILVDKGYTKNSTDTAITDMLSILRLLSMRCDAVVVNDAEMWAEWSYANEHIRLRYVALDAELCQATVPDPEAQALQEFYDKHKDIKGDPERGIVGYKLPSQVRVRYCAVPMDDVRELVDVTERQIRAYYKEHKDEPEFREEIEKPDDETPPADTSVTPEADTAIEPEETEPEYRTKTLKEMEPEIVEILTKEQAARLAGERLTDARKRLRALMAELPTGVLPLDQVASRSKLKAPRMARHAGREWLSSEELTQALPGGYRSASFAFAENRSPGDLEYFATADPPMLAQLIEFREERTPKLDEVREQVVADCRRMMAVDETRKLAEELAEQCRARSLPAAVDELSDRLKLKDDARLKLVKTDLFPRSSGKVADLADSFDLAQVAFDLEKDGFGVGTAGDVVYVFEVTQRRPGSVNEFQTTALTQRYQYEMRKQAGEMALWMHGLLGQAEYTKPKPVEKKAGNEPDGNTEDES